ncbi:MAG: hypothetical protein COV10_01420 [Candidatus Vogelbacteria bacterium CG10_big_fil_rev_8_21_14_0_10_51_16]|uniref:Uncharacterized protein n=1 Tax=Candidatus Vogelbacteria bacterium CG10_big_fil_rev_8_21_14_0_10_51_16 TaxID=1975045 RepID=A0A2H0REU5_9BACT|nr:MAG: hypothetical protein COV10_01420 [Candidatus Vogelbacteria bacterium CG10_big_fil_rev_8_21_14_0_10_51_16]
MYKSFLLGFAPLFLVAMTFPTLLPYSWGAEVEAPSQFAFSLFFIVLLAQFFYGLILCRREYRKGSLFFLGLFLAPVVRIAILIFFWA